MRSIWSITTLTSFVLRSAPTRWQAFTWTEDDCFLVFQTKYNSNTKYLYRRKLSSKEMMAYFVTTKYFQDISAFMINYVILYE